MPDANCVCWSDSAVSEEEVEKEEEEEEQRRLA